ILAADHSGGFDTHASATPRVFTFAEEFNGQIDGLGDVFDFQIARDDEVRVGLLNDASGGEGHRWVGFDVKEVARAQVVVAIRRTCVDRREVHRDAHSRGGYVFGG